MTVNKYKNVSILFIDIKDWSNLTTLKRLPCIPFLVLEIPVNSVFRHLQSFCLQIRQYLLEYFYIQSVQFTVCQKEQTRNELEHFIGISTI